MNLQAQLFWASAQIRANAHQKDLSQPQIVSIILEKQGLASATDGVILYRSLADIDTHTLSDVFEVFGDLIQLLFESKLSKRAKCIAENKDDLEKE